jgi:two-component system sensor histidine kinase RpfC
MEGKMESSAFESAVPRRLFYVEDHADSREMLTLILERAGYRMTTASSINEGLSVLKQERFDLIILDSRFADGSGLDLCRQIRLFDPLTPIIFYSSSAYASDIAAGLAAGAQKYLTKPLGIDTISETIAGLLTTVKPARVGLQRIGAERIFREASVSQ